VISQRLRFAVKTSGSRQYQLARAIGVHHSTLSCWLNGISEVAAGDPRVVRLGAILGVPAGECFEEEPRSGRLSDTALQGNRAATP
jgi:transcriptional regulator with XRE-family HTH domain